MNTSRANPLAETSLNDVWTEWIAAALSAAGVRHVVLCPGGRSSAMCIGLDADRRIDVAMVCTDERTGGFIALGIAKATHSPVAVVTTSGSAAANVVPALTEADACDVPVVLVTCDRPRHLRGAGFGQMIDHLATTTGFVRAQVDLDDPADEPAAVLRARCQVNQVLQAMYGRADAQPPDLEYRGPSLPPSHASPRRPSAGPVHLNVPFGGVYDAAEIQPASADTVLAARAPGPAIHLRKRYHEYTVDEMVDRICAKIRRSRSGASLTEINGLIVAGPNPGAPTDAIFTFAAATGFPVLADVSSGLRSGSATRPPQADSADSGSALIINPLDVLGSRNSVAAASPDLIVRFGQAPVSPLTHRYLGLNATVPVIKVVASAVARDYLHPELDPREILVAPSGASLIRLAGALTTAVHGATNERRPVGAVWRCEWARSACRGAHSRRDFITRAEWGEVVAAHECFVAPGYRFMHLGNSMSIRHADISYDVRPERQDIFVNRGVSGIDGTLSTFLGEVLARDDVGLLLLGDQALIHDISALTCAQRITKPACVCIMNNHGSAIFDFLPIANTETYERVIRNPYRLNIEAIAAGFGLHYERVQSKAAVREALALARKHAGVTIVEIVVDATSGVQQLRALTLALQGH